MSKETPFTTVFVLNDICSSRAWSRCASDVILHLLEPGGIEIHRALEALHATVVDVEDDLAALEETAFFPQARLARENDGALVVVELGVIGLADLRAGRDGDAALRDRLHDRV